MRAGHNSRQALETSRGLDSELKQVRKENEALREKVVKLETDNKIDSEAYRQVEEQLTSLQAEILKTQARLLYLEGELK